MPKPLKSSDPLTAKIDGNKRSGREHQRAAAKKILAAMKRGSGTSLNADEVYYVWCLAMHLWDEAAEGV